MVNSGVGDNNKSGFFEGASDVVSEGTGSESASNGLCASVGGKFKDSTVSVRTSGDDTNVVRIFNGSDDSGSENEFLPGLADVENVNS